MVWPTSPQRADLSRGSELDVLSGKGLDELRGDGPTQPQPRPVEPRGLTDVSGANAGWTPAPPAPE